MTLYAQYVKEREDFDTVETPEGFATYKVMGDECYLRDIYVTPFGRKGGHASFMADKITQVARSHGCKYLVGTVSPYAVGATESCVVLISYGFKIAKSDNQLIYFKKDL